MIFKFREFCKWCPVCTRCYHKGLQPTTQIAKKLSKKAEDLNKNLLIPFIPLRCKIKSNFSRLHVIPQPSGLGRKLIHCSMIFTGNTYYICD